ncbi:MAG: hypothetical protein WBL50_27335 [Candidatus Acidiferrum sp.]
MRGQMPVALFAIIFGALQTAGGTQELVYRGILNSETEPMIIGTLGTLGGVLLLAAGIALLVGSRLTTVLVPSAAYVGVPVAILCGVIKHYAGWPITLVGIVYPLFLFFFCYRFGKTTLLSKT